MWRTWVSTVFGLRKSLRQMPSFEWPSASDQDAPDGNVGNGQAMRGGAVERRPLRGQPERDSERDEGKVSPAHEVSP
jgi:hypothetical protein